MQCSVQCAYCIHTLDTLLVTAQERQHQSRHRCKQGYKGMFLLVR